MTDERNPADATRTDLLGQGGQTDEQKAAAAQREAEAAAEAERQKTEAAERAEAEKRAEAERAAARAKAKPKREPRARRGPPADGGSEDRQDAILTTSKLSSAAGDKLRRGMVVSVPSRRVAQLERAGRIRAASTAELEIAARRHGRAELK